MSTSTVDSASQSHSSENARKPERRLTLLGLSRFRTLQRPSGKTQVDIRCPNICQDLCPNICRFADITLSSYS